MIKRKIPWTRKPNNPKWDFSNPIVANATSLLSLSSRYSSAFNDPYDEAEKAAWSHDITAGGLQFEQKIVDGSIQWASGETDEGGIAYYSQADTINTDANPFFIVMSYTVLQAPTAGSVFQYADAFRNSTPVSLLRSTSSTELAYYVNGGNRFTAIPVQVGKKHLLIHRFNGSNTHDFYDSAKGVWETYAGASTEGAASNSFWLGTGYNAELPCAFEMFVGCVGYAPSLAECKELAKNPYSLYKPRTQYLPISTGAVPSGFIPAWARNNTLIGAL